eukprot:scaffold1863_cov85-Cylindrotheca_fusiformis.AAC.8
MRTILPQCRRSVAPSPRLSFETFCARQRLLVRNTSLLETAGQHEIKSVSPSPSAQVDCSDYIKVIRCKTLKERRMVVVLDRDGDCDDEERRDLGRDKCRERKRWLYTRERCRYRTRLAVCPDYAWST